MADDVPLAIPCTIMPATLFDDLELVRRPSRGRVPKPPPLRVRNVVVTHGRTCEGGPELEEALALLRRCRRSRELWMRRAIEHRTRATNLRKVLVNIMRRQVDELGPITR